MSFEVTANGSPVDANIYIDSSRINSSAYTFYESGEHTVIAKKDGYANSKKITIHVAPFGKFTFSSIYVSNGDVYIAGYKPLPSIPHRSTPVYWKNGNLHPLGGNGVIATSVYVANGNVYIAGYAGYPENLLGVGYWKNGNFHSFTYSGAAKSIYVSNNNVYVTGYVDYIAKAVYWKNGTRHKLSISGVAKAMDVSNENVYLAGYDSTGTAVYWKNGTLHKLGDGRANFINAIGEDVYVAGWMGCNDSYCVVKYWKNGALVSKYQISGSPALALSFISNGDVYVVGYLDGIPFYWKNGTPHKLDETN